MIGGDVIRRRPESGFFPEPTPSEIIIVFKKRKKISSISSKLATEFPCGNCNERLITDVFHRTFGGKLSNGKLFSCHTFMDGVVYDNFFEYKIDDDEFIHVPWKTVFAKRWHTWRAYYGCVLDDVILAYGTSSAYVEDALMGQRPPNKTKAKLLHFEEEKTNLIQKLNFLSTKKPVEYLCQVLCPTPLPSGVPLGHAIVHIGNNKVLLTGGGVVGRISNRVFLGELTENGTDVIWRQLESMKCARTHHIIFKMHQNVYVAGGRSELPAASSYCDKQMALVNCERYDLNENKWHECSHYMPDSLALASVVVSVDETFAVITGGLKKDDSVSDAIIIFTPDEGFVLLEKSSMLYQRSNHASIIIE